MTTSQQAIRSINCTSCGGPINLHGGHRVKAINCSYCGAVMDTSNHYQVVDQFISTQKPWSPIKVGQTGRLKNVDFIIIGMLVYRCDDFSSWMEFQLFSSTHGYAGLSYEKGHFVFSHKVRDRPFQLNRSIKSTIVIKNQRFKVFDNYTAKIAYVEGELTWIAHKDDSVNMLDAIAPPLIYCIENTASEEEYSLGEYLTADTVFDTFGVSGKQLAVVGVHPAQPYVPGKLITALSKAGKIFSITCLIIVLYVLVFGRGATVLTTSFHPDDMNSDSRVHRFTITDPDDLLGIYLDSTIDNSWAWYDVTFFREDEDVYTVGKEISYYHGYDDGYWSEGSQDTSAYFKLPEAGTYGLTLEASGAAGNEAVDVEIREGIIVSRYFVILLCLFILSAAAQFFSRQLFEARRWRGSADEDEDD